MKTLISHLIYFVTLLQHGVEDTTTMADSSDIIADNITATPGINLRLEATTQGSCLSISVGGGGDVSSPREYARSAAVQLQTQVDNGCDRNLRNQRFDWEMYRRTEARVEWSELDIPSRWINHRTLSIPSNSLRPGLYKIEVIYEARVLGMDNIDLTATTYIFITASDIVARIAGGAEVTKGLLQGIRLDASSSYDPDSRTSQQFSFSWSCYRESGICFRLEERVLMPTSVIELAGSELLFVQLPETFVFTVNVSTDDGRVSVARQSVLLLPGDPPSITVHCSSNCQPRLVVSEKLKLSSTCENCILGEVLGYQWSLRERSSDTGQFVVSTIALSTHAVTGTTGSSLVINANTFSGAVQREYLLQLTATRLDNSRGTSSYSYVTNTPPAVGSCSVEPAEGTVLTTAFNVTCQGFTDENMPLTYALFVTNAASASERLFASGLDEEFSSVYLPQGSPQRGHVLEIRVQVSDAYQASVSVSLQTTVRPLQISQADVSTLTSSLSTSSGTAAVQMISTLCSALNERTQDVTLGTEARESMVDILASQIIDSIETLQQTSAALSLVTAVDSEMSAAAQTQATDAVLQMSSFLRSQSQAGATSSQIEQAAASAMSTVSNLMTSVRTRRTTSTNATADSNAQSRSVTVSVLQALNQVSSALLSTKVAGEPPSVVRTRAFELLLARKRPDELNGLQYSVGARGASIQMPDQLAGVSGSSQDVDLEVIDFNENPFTWSNTSDQVSTSVTQLSLMDGTGPIVVRDIAQPIEFFLPNEIDGLTQADELGISVNGTSFVDVNYTSADAAVQIYVYLNDTQIYTEDDYVDVSVFYNVSSEGNVTVTSDTRALYTERLNLDELTTWPGRQLFLFPEVLARIGQLSVGYKLNSSLLEAVNISVQTSALQCLYWDTAEESWLGAGCRVGNSSSANRTHCLCTHLTSFAGGLLVMPNTINFQEDIMMFTRFWENPIGIIAVCIVIGVYIVLFVYARRLDLLNEIKAQPIDLADNVPGARRCYVLTVFTGTRPGASTTANICVVIIGSRGSSDVHQLSSGDYRVCQRGDVTTFLLRSEAQLGDITGVRIWHDNSGDDPSWFLSRLFVYDVSKRSRHYFICNAWFAVDIGDGRIDRTFSEASTEDLHNTEFLMQTHVNSGFQDKHLWFSLINPPAQSAFTARQRLSCCLTLLTAYMLTNIMFYGIEREPGEQTMDMGPFTITWTEIRIGIQSAVLIFPINLIIVWMFRNVRSRTPREVKHEYLRIDTDHTIKTNGTPSFFSFADLNHTPHTTDSFKSVLENESVSPPASIIRSSRHSTKSTKRVSISQAGSKDSKQRRGSGSKRPASYEESDVIPRFQSYSDMVDEEIDSADVHVDAFHSITDAVIRENPNPQKTSKPQKNPRNSKNSNVNNSVVDPSDVKVEIVNNTAEQGNEAGQNDVEDNTAEPENDAERKNVEDNSAEEENDASRRDVEDTAERKSRCSGSCLLPWWCIFIPWLLVVIATATCCFFTILYTFNFGLDKSFKWLRSLFTSFFGDLLVKEPLKVVGLAMFFSLVLRRGDMEQLDLSEELLVEAASPEIEEDDPSLEAIRAEIARLKQQASYRPPQQGVIRDAKRRRETERRMYMIASEIIRYIVFMYLITLLAYAQRDNNIVHVNENLRNHGLAAEDISDEVNGPLDIYPWLSDVIEGGLYDAERAGFFDERSAIYLSLPRLRQYRHLPQRRTCQSPLQGVRCWMELSAGGNDDGSYGVSWAEGVGGEGAEWRYENDTAFPSYTVSGLQTSAGGYIAELGSSVNSSLEKLEELESNHWLDQHTAGVALEFILYNANVNLATLVLVFFGFPTSGGTEIELTRHTMRLYRSTHSLHVFMIVFEVVYVAYTIYLIVHEVRTVKREKWAYFSAPGSVIDFLSCLLSLSVIAMYIAFAVEVDKTVSLYRSGGDILPRFQMIAQLDNGLAYVFGMLILVGMIKFLHLLRFNPLIYKFSMVLKFALPKLMWTFCIIIVMFLGFGMLSLIIMGPQLYIFSSLRLTLAAFFEGILGVMYMDDLNDFHFLFGPILYISFLFALCVLIFNLLVTVLMEAVSHVNAAPPKLEDAELLWLLVDKFVHWLGIRHRTS